MLVLNEVYTPFYPGSVLQYKGNKIIYKNLLAKNKFLVGDIYISRNMI